MTKIRTARTNCWLTLTIIALTLADTLNADNYYDFLENPIQGNELTSRDSKAQQNLEVIDSCK